MTRIIGGTAGGRRLRTPAGDGTRPTSDRVREALFSSLESSLGSLTGLRFLDLYAGSGAVGLEARSRGAGLVTLVEHDRRTVTVIRENARVLGLGGIDVVQQPVARFLQTSPRAPYDAVFADPPYALADADIDADLQALQAQGWLTPEAVVIVERSSRSPEPSWDGAAFKEKKYGETTLWLHTP